jgi:tRNA(Ile)-lysidine synthase
MDAEMDLCVEHVRATVHELAMLDPGDRVLAAVSGGADSMCLLDVLRTLGYSVAIAHFDHQTRHGESGADAAFVRELAGRLSLPFHLESRPVAEEAKESKYSFEEHARRARYEFLVRTAKSQGCGAVATGHHADDVAETILMRILVGVSPQGLAGIPPVREQAGVRIVRPLIRCTRAEVLAHLAARGLHYCEDRTNAETRHLRNRIRHELLPALARDYNPRVHEALVRLAEAQRADNEFLNGLAQAAFEACRTVDGAGLDRRMFTALHPAIQRRVILRLAWRHGVECPCERVVAAARFVTEAPTGHRFDLGGAVTLENARSSTEVLGEAVAQEDVEIPLSVPGVTPAFDRVFWVTCREDLPPDPLARYCTPDRQVFDADALGTVLMVRHRRPGDRFRPFGMSGTRKLQDYFVDIGLPVSQRDRALILCAGGRIAWIVGRAISAHVAVTSETRRVIEIEAPHAA